MKRSLPAFTPMARSRPAAGSESAGPRSMWISVQGPQGPVSPISQKLSLRPKRRMWLGVDVGHLAPERRSASSSAARPSAASPSKTVTHRRSLGSPQTSVRSSHAQRDGLALEVVAEGPVAEHLEEGVVVGVAPHLLEVVVLARDADALLGVGGARVGAACRCRGRRP